MPRIRNVGGVSPQPFFLCASYLLASERSERDTISGVQIRAGAVYISESAVALSI